MTGHTRELPEKSSYLVVLATAPAIWMAHFVASYGTAAVWCAKFAGRDGSSDLAQTAIAIYTACALAGIAFVGWGGYKRHSYGDEAVPHDMDTAGDRHRFLGFATLLLSGLSAVATIFVALAAVFFDTCR